MCNIVQLLAITCEENGARARPVSNTNNIALNVRRSVRSWSERLVVAAKAVRGVGYGELMIT